MVNLALNPPIAIHHLMILKNIITFILLLSILSLSYKPESTRYQVVLEEINFDFKSAILTEEQQQRLDTNILKIKWVIDFHNRLRVIDSEGKKIQDNTQNVKYVEIKSHSDESECAIMDTLLSYKRGNSIREYLKVSGKINVPIIIKSMGGKEYHYLNYEKNKYPELNRRAELNVY